jgi:hypothetical protein
MPSSLRSRSGTRREACSASSIDVFGADDQGNPQVGVAAAEKVVAERFGEPAEYPFVKGLPECPLVLPIIKEPHERASFRRYLAFGHTHLERPALGTLLYAIEEPPVGGDTMFASACANPSPYHHVPKREDFRALPDSRSALPYHRVPQRHA